MWIKSVQLVNFGPHKNLKLKLKRGLIGIFGPNGSGKSTVVDAIFYALTGDLSRFAGVKADNIRAGTQPNEKSFVKVEAEHDGIDFVVMRNLKTSNSYVEASGKRYTKAPEIKEVLESMGISKQSLDDYVFIGQQRLGEALIKTDGQRAEVFQRLCKTQRAAEIISAISDLRKAFPELTTTVADNSDDLRASLATSKSNAKAVKEKISSLATGSWTDKELEGFRQVLARKENRVRIAKDRNTAAERLAEHQATIAKLQPELDEIADELPSLEQELKKLDAATAKGESLLAEVKRWQRYVTKEAGYEKERETLLESEPVVLPDEEDNSKELEAEITKLKVRAGELNRFIRTGEGQCDSCGQLITADRTSELSQELKSVQDSLSQAETELAELSKRLKLVSDAKKRRDKWKQDVKHLADKIKSLDVVEEPETKIDADKVESLAATRDEVEEKVNRMKRRQRKLSTELSDATGSCREVQSQLDKLEAEFKDNAVTKTQCEEAALSLEANEKFKDAKNQLTGELKIHESAIVETQGLLDKLQLKLQSAAASRSFNGKLDSICEVFHRRALPRAVAAENIRRMEAGMNEALNDFNSPFLVEATDDLSFDCHFADKQTQRAQRLSVGQRSVLAIVFQQQVLLQFASELGMMWLDEPTAAMDADNVEFLRVALARYAHALSGNAQVVMITHSLELKTSFEQFIELDREHQLA